jgi:hypothetical protein
MIDEILADRDTRFPVGLCLAIWTVLAVIGWSAIGAATRLI